MIAAWSDLLPWVRGCERHLQWGHNLRGVHVNIASIIETHDAARIAIIDGDDALTYGELRDWAAAIRQLLTEHGVGPDDRVAVPAGNEPAFVARRLVPWVSARG